MLLLPILLFLPLAFLLPLAVLNKRRSFEVSIAAALAAFILVIASVAVANARGFQGATYSFIYLPASGITISLDINAITQILAIMTALVLLASSIVAKSFIKEREKLYNLLFIVLITSTLGAFLAADLVVFYVFWEISEVVMFFLIYSFGGYNRHYAAMKFIMFSIASSAFFLLGILVIYSGMPLHTFSIAELIANGKELGTETQIIAMSMLLIAFIIKMPIFPLHIWQPDAYAESPVPATMLLAGVLPKFGSYGLLLMFLMLPYSSKAGIDLALLFALSALYAGFVTIRQYNMKKAIAYISMVDMAVIALGIASASPIGYSGALYAMLSHGIVIALLFLIAGSVDEAYGTLLIDKIRGVVKNFKWLAYSFVFSAFAVAGLPLTAGFIGDLLIFSGVAKGLGPLFMVPLLSILMVTLFLLWIASKVFFNMSKSTEPYSFLSRSIMLACVFLILASLFFGILPVLFVNTISAALASA